MLRLGESHVDLLRDRVQLILYTIPHRERIEVAADVEEIGGQPRVGNRRDNLLLRISARHVTESREDIDPGSVARRIVVIGASHWENNDRHATPLGVMPGAMVIVNAIDTALQHGAIRPSPWLGLTAGLGLVLAVAALFHYLNFSIASYVSLLVIFLVTLSLGAYSLRWGIWLDTALPALCLLVIKWFVNLKKRVAELA